MLQAGVKVVTAPAVLAAAPAWAVTNLGTPPGHPVAFVQGILVNAHGTVVAIGGEGVGTSTPRQQAFVWRAGRKTALTYRRARFIEPSAIDRAGDVVGTAGSEAVLWRKGVPTALGAFSPGGMSDNGRFVVGTSNVGGQRRAFLWHAGTLTELPGLGGTDTQALAVNRSGTVVGSSALPAGVDHAVVWRNGVPTDLGSVHGLSSEATLITNDGTILGFASVEGADCCSSVVLEWKQGRLVDLGRFGATSAQPIAVNAHGDVLVETETADQSTIGLRLLRDGKTIRVEVPPLRHQHLYGVGLDDEDDVVGHGLTTQRGFLWRKGRVTLLPPDVGPRAVAGGWIVGSRAGGGGVLLRLRLASRR